MDRQSHRAAAAERGGVMETPQVGDVWLSGRERRRRVTKVEDGRVEYLVNRHKYVCPRQWLPLDEFLRTATLIERDGKAVLS